MVYKAIHKKTKEVRAVKMIMKDNASNSEEAKITDEIKVLKGLVPLSSRVP